MCIDVMKSKLLLPDDKFDDFGLHKLGDYAMILIDGFTPYGLFGCVNHNILPEGLPQPTS